MNSAIRALGKVLRLVGISSPEDMEAQKDGLGGPPSWRTAAAATPVEPETVTRQPDKMAAETKPK